MRDLKHSTDSFAPTRWMRVRVALLGVLFIAALGGDFVRAFVLQVRQKDKLKSMAQDQYVRELELPARRGEVFDRRGVPLAQSVDVDSIFLDPSRLEDPKLAARQLARDLDLDEKDFVARMARARRFLWVKRQATQAEVAKVKVLNLAGIGFTREPRRFYPQRELASHVLGMVGTEGRGLDGLELAFDDELAGDAVKNDSFRDARGRKLLTSGTVDLAARDGAQVTLTLDRHLQYITEKALFRAVQDSKATAGMAVVLDPRTGELLAIANVPTFNPNAPSGPSDAFRNRSITDQFEPGSTFKAFVVAAALDARTINESSTFNCEMGAWKVGKYTINDTHQHGVLDARGVLQVSSNICAAKIAGTLGRERLVDAFTRFGFGARLGLGLPGETKGSVPFPKAEIQLATQAYGQGITASAVQVASAYGALANGGVLMRPFIVAKVVDPDGVVLLENQPTEVRRVVSEKSARTVVSMLESVVEKGGTAPLARMDEYRVAGKTGTAQKADPVHGGYSDKRIASFVGMVPAEDPHLVVLVVVDEPKTDVYGGLVAAPAFKEIASAAMPYLGITPSRSAPVKEVAMKPSSPVAPAAAVPQVSAELAAALDAATLDEGTVRVPDLAGQPARGAVGKLLSVALEPRLLGSGAVARQTPSAGSAVPKGSRVTLELAGALPLTAR